MTSSWVLIPGVSAHIRSIKARADGESVLTGGIGVVRPQEITTRGRTTHTIPTRKDRRIADRLSLVRRIPPQVFPTDRAHMARPRPHPPLNREGCCPPRTPAGPPGGRVHPGLARPSRRGYSPRPPRRWGSPRQPDGQGRGAGGAPPRHLPAPCPR